MPRVPVAQEAFPSVTIINVAASTDTTGDSSGSPVVNVAGEIIGANFDSTVLTQRNAYGTTRT